MLRSISRFQVNTFTDFMAVHRNPQNLSQLPVQNESLCLYAIYNHGLLSEHPWESIRSSNRTPAVQLLTAVTSPHLIVRDILKRGVPVPDTTLSAVVARDPCLYPLIPDLYKTDNFEELYRQVSLTKPELNLWV